MKRDDVLTAPVSIDWEEIKNKPTRFEPTEHTHDISWREIIGKPVEFTPEYHTHDEYAKRYHRHTIADIIGLDGVPLNDGVVPEHFHDDRYYTKTQVNELLENIGSNVDMSSYATKEYVNAELAKKSDIDHKHDLSDFEGLEGFADFYKPYTLLRSDLIQDENEFYIGNVTHNLQTTSIETIIEDKYFNRLLADVSIIDDNNISVLTDVYEDLTVYVKKLNLTT